MNSILSNEGTIYYMEWLGWYGDEEVVYNSMVMHDKRDDLWFEYYGCDSDVKRFETRLELLQDFETDVNMAYLGEL